MHALSGGRGKRGKRRRGRQINHARSPLERAEHILPYPKFMRFQKEPRGSAYQIAPLPSLVEIQLETVVQQKHQIGWMSEVLRIISEIKCISASTPPAKVISSAMTIQRRVRLINFKRKMTEKWNILVSFRYMVEHFAALKLQCFIRQAHARRKVDRMRYLWHASNAVKIQCLARKHLAVNMCKSMRAKNLMKQIKKLIPGGKMSRLLLMGHPHFSPVSFSSEEAQRLQGILVSILQPPKDIVWLELLQGRRWVNALIERNTKRKLILQERHRLAKALGTAAVKFTEDQRLLRAETGKKVLALRSEIELNRTRSKMKAEREEREGLWRREQQEAKALMEKLEIRKQRERQEREIMWREDQRMAKKNRLRKQLHDVASAVASVSCDQAMYLAGSVRKRSDTRSTERHSPSGPNEMTYLL